MPPNQRRQGRVRAASGLRRLGSRFAQGGPFLGCGELEDERRTAARLRLGLHPNSTAVGLGESSRNRKPEAAPGAGGTSTLEGVEDPFAVRLRDTGTSIPDADADAPTAVFDSDVDRIARR